MATHIEQKSLHTERSPLSVDMGRVAALVLGGGAGSRLHPLTLSRCKPAICFGGATALLTCRFLIQSIQDAISSLF